MANGSTEITNGNQRTITKYKEPLIRKYASSVKTIALAALILVVGVSTGLAVVPAPDVLSNALKKRILQAQENHVFSCADELLCGASIIPDFYSSRDYMPLWCQGEGFFDRTKRMISLLATALSDGLRPEDYHVAALEHRLDVLASDAANHSPLDIQGLVDFELLLTDGVLMYASHLAGGRVNPETVHAKWFSTNQERDFTIILETACETEMPDELFEQLRPPHQGYRNLKSALKQYRNISLAPPLPKVPHGPSLKKGKKDTRIPILRQRLRQLGDLAASDNSRHHEFDTMLEKAVRRFQYRHGLQVDGIVGKDTLNALNISTAYRLRQMELNLERWRWIPRSLGDRHLLINIADFNLKAVDHGQTVLEMRVVVGNTYRETPVFSETMKYLVINPRWHVPTKIAVKDLLPKIKKDPQFLLNQHFRVFDGWKDDAHQIDPNRIDWWQIPEDNFPFKLMQDAGPQNPLGRIKFMLPNRFAVYLHDTPQRSLFERSVRGFSSGCIRVERAVDLAAYVLSDLGRWPTQRIESLIETGERKIVLLEKRIPVHILYWTAWVSPEGLLHFRRDVYDRDKPLDEALRNRLVMQDQDQATSTLHDRYRYE